MEPPAPKSAHILYERYEDFEDFEQEFIALKDEGFDIQWSYSIGRRKCWEYESLTRRSLKTLGVDKSQRLLASRFD